MREATLGNIAMILNIGVVEMVSYAEQNTPTDMESKDGASSICGI